MSQSAEVEDVVAPTSLYNYAGVRQMIDDGVLLSLRNLGFDEITWRIDLKILIGLITTASSVYAHFFVPVGTEWTKAMVLVSMYWILYFGLQYGPGMGSPDMIAELKGTGSWKGTQLQVHYVCEDGSDKVTYSFVGQEGKKLAHFAIKMPEYVDFQQEDAKHHLNASGLAERVANELQKRKQ